MPRSSSNAHYSYSITVNNPVDEEESLISLPFQYCCFCYEEGLQKTPHIQAYVRFPSQFSFNTVKSILPSAHIESCKGNPKQNIDYICREGAHIQKPGLIAGPYEHGVRPSQGKRNDLVSACSAISSGRTIRDLVMSDPPLLRIEKYLNSYQSHLIEPRNRGVYPQVTIIWGPSGVGKTKMVYDKYCDSVYDVPHPARGGMVWFDGYSGQKCILYDDFPLLFSDMYSHLLKISDRYPLRMPVKGSFVNIGPSDICITSNNAPSEWFCGSGLQALTRRVTKIIKLPVPSPVSGVVYFNSFQQHQLE